MYEIFPSTQLMYNIYRLSLIINLIERIVLPKSYINGFYFARISNRTKVCIFYAKVLQQRNPKIESHTNPEKFLAPPVLILNDKCPESDNLDSLSVSLTRETD